MYKSPIEYSPNKSTIALAGAEAPAVLLQVHLYFIG